MALQDIDAEIPAKIHGSLGWLLETKFEDAIRRTIRWYLENRDWWEPIISGEYREYYEKMYGEGNCVIVLKKVTPRRIVELL